MSEPALLPGLSIVLPCYDEAGNVATAVAEAEAAAARTSERFEIIVVDDGSRDDTGAIAAQLAEVRPSVHLVAHDKNRGYGAALRSGIAAASMPYILLTDADLQFDLMQLEEILPLVGTADMIVGYRAVRMDPAVRRFDAFMWRMLVRVVLGLKLRDVDCAFKLLPRELIASLDLVSEGATVSTELMIKAMRTGATVREVPVRHRPRIYGKQSGADTHVILLAFRELAALRQRLAQPGPSTSTTSS